MKWRLSNLAVYSLLPFALLFYVLPGVKTETKETVLFAVWAPNKEKLPEAYILDPVVRIQHSALSTPIPSDDNSRKAWDDFRKNYYGAGTVYPLLLGGDLLGEVSVKTPEFMSLAAAAQVSSPIPAGSFGVAVTSLDGIRLHKNWRHPASGSQRSKFASFAIQYLQSHGVPSASTASLRTGDLEATRVSTEDSELMIGNVLFEDKKQHFDLFLVITSQDKPEALIVSVHESKDLQDGMDIQEEKFVDQLDLDGDGGDEIITISNYYESWDYTIYKQENGSWNKIYHGAGAGF